MEASEPMKPMSASPEITAVIVLSAPNGVSNLGEDSLNKVNVINCIIWFQMDLSYGIFPESSFILRG